MTSSAEPSSKESKDPSQLITPLLTPVVEESPFSEDSPSFQAPIANGHQHANGTHYSSQSSQIPSPIDSDAYRVRSSSVPSTGLDRSDEHTNSSLTSRRLTTASSNPTKQPAKREVLKLTSKQIKDLTSAPESLPIRSASPPNDDDDFHDAESRQVENFHSHGSVSSDSTLDNANHHGRSTAKEDSKSGFSAQRNLSGIKSSTTGHVLPDEPVTPESPVGPAFQNDNQRIQPRNDDDRAPDFRMHDSLPLPPLSMPTYLHLELSSEDPSPLYVYNSPRSEAPYEATHIKFERLLNFLLLPPQIERTLWFGTLACLDAWLYTFTILPLRFLKALWILLGWASNNFMNEIRYLTSFVWRGSGRLWYRRRQSIRRSSEASNPSHRASESESSPNGDSKSAITTDLARLRNLSRDDGPNHTTFNENAKQHHQDHDRVKYHKRSRSVPSSLQPNHKADLIQGTLILVSCMILIRFDASRMYHGIRGQGAIKLYVIYNVLEVCDRLFSALGQDIVECLFSPETLNRWPNGRSKVIKPFWMFILALVYTVAHATAFFYQVITLNVAVNSYSNALLTLLMSNQFVEIKSTVFKKFEKENLFQLTCADVVERFQLWLMLVIIALRNIVEMGGLSVGSSADSLSGPSASDLGEGFGGFEAATNSTAASNMPFNILPNAFTMLPSLFPAQVLVPFLFVLAVEMLVDWLKHAYITKFNAISPYIYGRFYDVLTKDYYSTAFRPQQEQGLVRRLGLPTIPLACLFIRAILQTYHMFLATNISSPARNAATGLSGAGTDSSIQASASTGEGYFDQTILRALGRSSFGGGSTAGSSATAASRLWRWTLDDAIALTTMLVFFLVLYLLLLAFKLILSMVLLRISRNRYAQLKQRELRNERDRERGRPLTQDRSVSYSIPAKRLGAWGSIEIGEERRRIIYQDDADGLARLQDREARAKEKERSKIEALSKGQSDGLDGVDRYRMVAKRIW